MPRKVLIDSFMKSPADVCLVSYDLIVSPGGSDVWRSVRG